MAMADEIYDGLIQKKVLEYRDDQIRRRLHTLKKMDARRNTSTSIIMTDTRWIRADWNYQRSK